MVRKGGQELVIWEEESIRNMGKDFLNKAFTAISLASEETVKMIKEGIANGGFVTPVQASVPRDVPFYLSQRAVPGFFKKDKASRKTKGYSSWLSSITKATKNVDSIEDVKRRIEDRKGLPALYHTRNLVNGYKSKTVQSGESIKSMIYNNCPYAEQHEKGLYVKFTQKQKNEWSKKYGIKLRRSGYKPLARPVLTSDLVKQFVDTNVLKYFRQQYSQK